LEIGAFAEVPAAFVLPEEKYEDKNTRPFCRRSPDSFRAGHRLGSAATT
jgi:hypothetical protein